MTSKSKRASWSAEEVTALESVAKKYDGPGKYDKMKNDSEFHSILQNKTVKQMKSKVASLRNKKKKDVVNQVSQVSQDGQVTLVVVPDTPLVVPDIVDDVIIDDYRDKMEERLHSAEFLVD